MNKRERVIKEILALIRNDQLLEGNKLPSERNLAESLGVSRVLLREAIVALETLGILEVKKRFGIFVGSRIFRG
ncbi:MAG TPA: GntR family transcriptional regulator [Synergistaceae bacterium]|nr:GntR family transcriptional regulator [Synergistaceae bacterium]